MISKAFTITLLAAVLAGSVEAGHLRHNGHKHNKRADIICGTKGYDREQGNYFYDNGGKFNSYAACSAACLADVKCLSFAYSKQECMHFNISLKDNFDADKGSSDVYYDRGCLASAGSAPSSTTKSSTAPAAKAASSTSKSSTTPAPSSSSKSKSSSKPSVVATTPSTTKSSTAAGGTTSSSAGGAGSTPSTTASAAPDFPTANPYESKGCPMPKAIAISDLKSTIDSAGTNTASVKIQYGNGTFTCPGRCGSYDGQFDCNCDSDGLLRVISDGRNWIWVQEWYWCDAQEQRPNKAYQSLALTLNFTGLADYVKCDKSTKTCTQSKPLLAPVGGYGGGGIIGFSPIDVNGNDLPNCPYRPGHSPIVTNTATCTAAAAAATP